MVARRNAASHELSLTLLAIEAAHVYIIYIKAAANGVHTQKPAGIRLVAPETEFWLHTPVFPFLVTNRIGHIRARKTD